MQTLIKPIILLVLIMTSPVFSQTTSTFEFPSVPAPGYWNGNNLSGGFSSGNIYFPNVYDTSFGGYWASGFAWSTLTDSITSGFLNLYSCKAASGFQSPGYALAQNHATFILTGTAAGKSLQEVKVCNSTYAFNSMRDGDSFAKKFGGSSGNDPDFFKVTFIGYEDGLIKTDSIEYYLADYRFSNNSLDYIVDTWETVNLTALGNCDSVMLRLTSSDIGSFGMNTPGFVCLDNLISTDVYQSAKYIQGQEPVQLLNPENSMQDLQFKSTTFSQGRLIITSINGSLLCNMSVTIGQPVDMSYVASGIYQAILIGNNEVHTFKLLKNE